MLRYFLKKFLYPIVFRFHRLIQEAKVEQFIKQLGFCGKEVVFKSEVMLVRPNRIFIDDYTQLGERSYLRGGGEIHIGKYCLIANNVIIVTGNHNINGKLYYNNVTYADVIIGDNVWIASNALILPGVKIGNNAVVAAGAVVTSDISANTIVGGIPAEVIRKIDIHPSLDLEAIQ